MAEHSNEKWLTTNWAGYLVGVLLIGAAIVGNLEQRTVSAEDVDLRTLPSEIGAWAIESDEVEVQPDGSYKSLTRMYQADDGRQVYVKVQATRTRLGSLRDWSLAGMADGWTAAEETVWSSPDGQIDARIERLVKNTDTRIALSWYTSAASQAPSLKKAEIFGAWDRILGGRKPWASLYIIAASGDEQADRAAVKDIAAALGPSLRQIMDE